MRYGRSPERKSANHSMRAVGRIRLRNRRSSAIDERNLSKTTTVLPSVIKCTRNLPGCKLAPIGCYAVPFPGSAVPYLSQMFGIQREILSEASKSASVAEMGLKRKRRIRTRSRCSVPESP